MLPHSLQNGAIGKKQTFSYFDKNETGKATKIDDAKGNPFNDCAKKKVSIKDIKVALRIFSNSDRK